jgi:hypothetical protein
MEEKYCVSFFLFCKDSFSEFWFCIEINSGFIELLSKLLFGTDTSG